MFLLRTFISAMFRQTKLMSNKFRYRRRKKHRSNLEENKKAQPESFERNSLAEKAEVINDVVGEGEI
jgi:hypothetical protein